MKVITLSVLALVAMVSARHSEHAHETGRPHHEARSMNEHKPTKAFHHEDAHHFFEARSKGEHEMHKATKTSQHEAPHHTHEARFKGDYSEHKVAMATHRPHDVRSKVDHSEHKPTKAAHPEAPHHAHEARSNNQHNEHKATKAPQHPSPHYTARSEHEHKHDQEEPSIHDYPSYLDKSKTYVHPHTPARMARPLLNAHTAIFNVRNILTGASGIRSTCDRCVAAMSVGQQLAQESPSDFSNAVVGLCKAVRFRGSDAACANDFSPEKVAPYISTLAHADIARDGKSFCKSYFQTCR